MGRNRDYKKDQKLPPYVYRKKARDLVEYRPYIAKGVFGKSIYLKDAKGKNLKADAPLEAIYKAYSKFADEPKPNKKTLAWLLNEYFKSIQFARLAQSTKRHYRIMQGIITNKELSNGMLFGDLDLKFIKPPVIAGYRDSRADTKVSANRELQFLSAVFSWSIEKGYVEVNPCHGVRKFEENSRDRYIEDDEYKTVYDLAPAHIKVMMEISYLCRARRGEVLALIRNDVLEGGVFIKRSKGSDSEVTLWSPRLKAAIDAARSHNNHVLSRYILHDAKGLKYRNSALDTAWQRLMRKALKSGLKERFTILRQRVLPTTKTTLVGINQRVCVKFISENQAI